MLTIIFITERMRIRRMFPNETIKHQATDIAEKALVHKRNCKIAENNKNNLYKIPPPASEPTIVYKESIQIEPPLRITKKKLLKEKFSKRYNNVKKKNGN